MDITEKRLTVRELPPGVTADVLKKSFERFGKILGAHVINDQGYIVFANAGCVSEALRSKHVVAGKEIAVDVGLIKVEIPKMPKLEAPMEIKKESAPTKRHRTKGPDPDHIYSKMAVGQSGSNARGVVSGTHHQVEIVDVEKEDVEKNQAEEFKNAMQKIEDLESQLRTERQVNSQRMVEERGKINELKEEIVKLQRDLVAAVDAQKDVDKNKAEELRKAVQQIADVESQLRTERQLNSQRMEEEREKFKELEKKLAKLRQDLVGANGEITALQNNLNASTAENAIIKRERDQLALEYHESEKKLKAQIDFLQCGKVLVRDKLVSMNGEFDAAERRLEQLLAVFQQQTTDQKTAEVKEEENAQER